MMRMVRCSVVLVLSGLCILVSNAPSRTLAQDGAPSAGSEQEAAIRERISSYVETFNAGDAEGLGGYWAADGVSVNQETGERTSGREALVEEMKTFFGENTGVRLTGQVDQMRLISPDVASIEGHTTLFVGDAAPVDSTFNAVLVRDNGQWLISSSHERSVPVPPSHQDALRELEWLVGDWQDDSEETLVRSRFRWSPSGVYLIRSFSAQFADDDMLEGTQIFGWDPVSRQIRTWTFASDGSFGQGTVVKTDDGWMLKKWQVLNDGRVASATRMMTRTDDDTLSVATIGHTVDGEPQPSAGPVTVVRVGDGSSVSQTDASDEEGAE